MLALALLLLTTTEAWGDAGLDLVMLVDRSKSMAHHARLEPALLHMSADLLARNAEAYRVRHRMAVVSFGSSATVDVPFTEVRTGELLRIHRSMSRLPSAQDRETDILGALVAAERLFQSISSDPTRRRAIVLVTDGVPYVRGADMDRYSAELRQFLVTRSARSSISMDLLLLATRDTARHEALWHSLLARGVHRVDRDHAEMLAEAHGVVTRLIGTPTAEGMPSKTDAGVEALIVPPYLDVIVFDVFRGSSDATVDVFPPGSATPVRGGVGGVESVDLGDVLVTLVVATPRPGQWTIRKSRPDARVRILSQQFFPRGVLLNPSSATPPTTHDRISIAYRVLDGNRRPIQELPDYALSLEVTIAAPNGMTTVIPMERDAGLGAAAFQSAHPTECKAVGRYWTDVRVTTVDVQGRRLDVFRDRWSGFTVVPWSGVDSPRHTSTAGVPPSTESTPRPRPLYWLAGPLIAACLLIRSMLRRYKTKA